MQRKFSRFLGSAEPLNLLSCPTLVGYTYARINFLLLIYMEKQREDVKQHILDFIYDYEGIQADELHNALFNEGYYIIGTHLAKEWLGMETFEAIEMIRQYEQDNFGEVNTDFSDPEKVVNMTAYILGEEILYNTGVELDGKLTKEKIEEIKEALA